MNQHPQSSPDRDRARGAGRVPRFLTTTGGAAMACLVALLLAVAGVLAPLAITEMRRQAAIAQTREIGEIQFDPGPPARWGWIGSLLPERFGNVKEIDLKGAGYIGMPIFLGGRPTYRGVDLTPYDLGNLRYFPEVNSLLINGSVNQDQLLLLTDLENLETLELYCDQANDAVIGHLVTVFPNLKAFGLISVSVTDQSIHEICRLEHLESLDLSGTSIHARALRELQTLKRLSMLRIEAGGVTPAEQEELRRILPIDGVAPPAPVEQENAAEAEAEPDQGGNSER